MARGKTPAQIAALALGAWWTLNGVAAFIGDANFAVGNVHGEASLLGYDVPVNGWHALFHLVPGLVGLAVATRPEPSRLYALAAGAFYLVAAASGFMAGGTSLGVIQTDTFGNAVHAVEGLVALTAGIVSARFAPTRAAPAG
jgi:hypothetical protein